MGRRLLKIVSILAVIIVLVIVVANPIVSAILRSDHHTLLSERIMLISMKKQGSSEEATFPVNYLREGNTVYIGADFSWWEHLQGGAEVDMLIAGSEFTGWATPILDDPDRTSAGFKKLRPSTYERALATGAVFIEVQIQNEQNGRNEQAGQKASG